MRGHVAGLRLAGSDLNPLWEPPWPGIEPEDYDPAQFPEYGKAEGRLLASVVGHFLCLDRLGGVKWARSTPEVIRISEIASSRSPLAQCAANP